MNLTHPYWNPPAEFKPHKGLLGPENHRGFFFKLPHPDIQTAGWYFGENPMPDRRELSFKANPEYFAVDGILPASGGVPKFDPRKEIYKYKRSDFTVKKV